jgi:glucosamine 6-phosphate synthetase-like amidotransferase/phosphosugar isomerase protein
MCGIVGYYGKQDAVPILINGLKRLEYRGYDSAGIAVLGQDGIQFIKKSAKVSVLDKLDTILPQNSNACRVIPPVFQTLEPINKNWD